MDYISDILSNFQLKTVHVDPGMTLNSFYFSYQNSAASTKFRSEKLSTVSPLYFSSFSQYLAENSRMFQKQT